ncbi:ribulose-phosphate 3-epimerase [Mycoplasmopsis gallinarum]|uniref:Ribulose-phosphate 3-epimerase n=1 Tax=Mycoplasmopsis gallinarum TaxID=29557 RepID=A0A168RFP9_9BACT|nr:ribulose-phosphate 3-epimerase [Mycoplasmopsis gallinarum]OAB48937.1 Ribulose-phosphate 3-epimerase [Mycoplasmopsis gallinarum]
MTEKFVTPSLLNVDEGKRLEMADLLINEGIKWIHYDVMDGEFVPNIAIQFEEIKEINEKGKKHFKDIHLMVENPLEYLEIYQNVGDILTVHFEAIKNKSEFLSFLKNNKKTAEFTVGLAIKPNTAVSEIEKFLPYVALVLVMSVEPGFGGQKFIPEALNKISQLKQIREKEQLHYLIQVDGGINNETGPQCFNAGADACVAGSFLIKNPNKDTIDSILGS